MTGTSGIFGAVNGLGRNALDVPVAGLAALAVAFAAFAVPADQLAGLVGSTGLPELLPAAQPPLGSTARLALGAAGAIAAFAVIFGLLRWLGRKPVRRTRPEDEAPRVRRRDLHPDAPTRRPISATLEFGEPEAKASANPDVPAWLSPAEIGWEEEVDRQDEGGDLPAFAEPDLEPVSETPAFAEPVYETRPPEDTADEDHFVEPSPASSDQPTFKSVEPARPVIVAQCPPRSETIAELMERLEQGLSRRQPASESLIRTSPTLPSPEPQPRSSAQDDRLQSAIDSLQRLASRQG